MHRYQRTAVVLQTFCHVRQIVLAIEVGHPKRGHIWPHICSYIPQRKSLQHSHIPVYGYPWLYHNWFAETCRDAKCITTGQGRKNKRNPFCQVEGWNCQIDDLLSKHFEGRKCEMGSFSLRKEVFNGIIFGLWCQFDPFLVIWKKIHTKLRLFNLWYLRK